MDNQATAATFPAAQSLLSYYYGLAIDLPYYVGGYFWWYYDEDCLPVSKTLWSTLRDRFLSEAAALSR